MDRTSCVKHRALSMSNRSSRAVSCGSENHNLIGTALSESKRERGREEGRGRGGGGRGGGRRKGEREMKG